MITISQLRLRMIFHRFTRQAHKCAAALLATFLFSLNVLSSVSTAGDFDPTFGTGGRVITDFGRTFDQASGVALQKDGKIVAAGSSGTIEPGSNDFALARYNSNGSLDSSFGGNGLVTSDFGGLDDFASGVAVQSDNKIVAAGTTDNSFAGTSLDFAIARYNTNGTLDATFGNNGKVTTDFTNGHNDIGTALAIESTGKILVAGTTVNPSSFKSDFAIARYNTDGSLDTTFGNGGKVTTDFLGSDDDARAIGIQSNGKIILAGVVNTSPQPIGFIPDHNKDDFGLARYNANGSLDTSFGTGGKVITDFGGFLDRIFALAIQPDGRIVVAGDAADSTFPSNINTDFALARYNSNGSVDTSFGIGGKVTADFTSFAPEFASFDMALGLVIQADNKIVVTGAAHSLYAFVRYKPNGDLDLSFGVNGMVVKQGIGQEIYFGIVIQPDGKLVAAGFGGLVRDIDFVVARLNNDAFDLCVQDDSSASTLRLNSVTGSYQFTNCLGLTITGIGTLNSRGGTITLQHVTADRRVQARIDTSSRKGTSSIQLFSHPAVFTITDRDIGNNTCNCP